MNAPDKHLRAVMQRLELKPTVDYEVAREVREHLEDAVERVREQGSSGEHRLRAALKAFSAADELPQQLWRANRQRTLLGVPAIWARRPVLVPLVAGAAVDIGSTMLRSPATRLGWVSGRGLAGTVQIIRPFTGPL